jgi:hypothetical protein
MPRWLIAVIVSLSALLWWLAHRNSAPLAAGSPANGAVEACRVLQSPSVLENMEVQTEQSAMPFRVDNATLTPLAAFSVSARVLSREDYNFGRESKFSPTDLALGWGPMAAPGLADLLQISQGGRWYRYRWEGDGPPLPPAQIAHYSANMHMVPANVAAKSALARVRAGDTVRLDGWLVRIESDDGWSWSSSMSRDDVGAGACEIVLVCTLRSR